MPVLDTTVLLAGEKDPLKMAAYMDRLRDTGEPVVIPVQVAIEYATGRPDPAQAMRRLRDDFLLMPMGPEIALEAARLARETLARGTFPGWADIQVAATARHEGLAVVTKNRRHFQEMGIVILDHP